VVHSTEVARWGNMNDERPGVQLVKLIEARFDLLEDFAAKDEDRKKIEEADRLRIWTPLQFLLEILGFNR